MKKSIVKEIRKVSSGLPVIMRHSSEIHPVLGSELILQGVTEAEGKPVVSDSLYTCRMPVMIAINHENKLKKEYKENGTNGMKAYILAVMNHAKLNNIVNETP